jgi:hypothetical protein
LRREGFTLQAITDELRVGRERLRSILAKEERREKWRTEHPETSG